MTLVCISFFFILSIHYAMEFVEKLLQNPPVMKERAMYLDWYEKVVSFDQRTRGTFDGKSRYVPPP